MARVPKPMRWDQELMDLVNEKTEGKDFTDKVHNALYRYYKEEEKINARIKQLEKRESELRDTIKGLETIRDMTKAMFMIVGDLFDAVGQRQSYKIDSITNQMNDMLKKIKKVL